MASSLENRSIFIQSCIDFMIQHGFDGLDVDWEYPGSRPYYPSDYTNYPLLLQELNSEFKSHPNKFLLTLATPIGRSPLQYYDFPNIHPYVDFINVMAYDIHGIWDNPKIVQSQTDIRVVDSGLQIYFNGVVPSTKINLGLGAYGRTYKLADKTCNRIRECYFVDHGTPGRCTQSNDTMSLFEIKEILESDPTASSVLDEVSMSKYMYYGEYWISYDDEETFELRKSWAQSKGLGGLMYWAVDMIKKTELSFK